MKCPKCNHIFELSNDENKLTKEIFSLAMQGKKEEIKKLYPKIAEKMPWMKELLK